MTTRLLVALLAASSLLRAGETNDPRLNAYDALHYDLAITLDMQARSFHGSVAVEAVARKAMHELVLCASEETITVDSAASGGRPLALGREGGTVVLALPAELPAGKHTQVTLWYHGTSGFSGAYDDGGLFFSPAGHVASSSEPQFARRWWPCKDMPSDKATVSVAVTLPDSMTAVSNGLLRGVDRRDGTATFRWETRYPIATYLVSIAAARYESFTDEYTSISGRKMRLEFYAFPRDLAKAREDFGRAKELLAWLETNFCEYPFIDEKFGYAEVEGDLTMENQTICSIQSTLVTGDHKGEQTLFHETAHHWFGDLITTANWHNTWLNEGFATYAEALWLESTKGREAYARFIGRLMAAPQGTYAKPVVGRSDTAFWDSFGSSVYFKGALVLHMLRGVVGDSAFFTALRSYVRNPNLRYGNATTDDFRLECERASHMPLKWFFDQWLYRGSDAEDRPVVAWSWKEAPGGAALTLRQESTPPYRLLLPVSIYAGGRAVTTQIVDSTAEQSWTIGAGASPDSLVVDPESSVFMTLKRRPR